MVVVEAVSSLFTEGVLQRRSLRKLLFNIPLLSVTVGAAGLTYRLFGDLTDTGSPVFLIPLLASGIVYYLVNTWSLSLIIAFDSGRKPYHVWMQNYMWYFFHIFAFLPMAAIIALLYQRAGGWTIALFIIPLFLARYSFQLYLDMREKNIETVAALTSAIDASDAFTHGHSFRVSQYATKVAKALGMSSKEIETLEYASLLHDVGKISVSNTVLQKVEPLTDEEWITLRAHPDVGADIVERLKFLKEAAEIIRCHHERPDGTGYPRGLKEDKIPMGANILNVVDAFDAMTSNRPYRDALPAEVVINELRKYRGTQFHAEVADLVLDLYRSGELDSIIGSKATPGIYDSLKETIQV
jgi:putative nucleotidyltransferase with HDIG domain